MARASEVKPDCNSPGRIPFTACPAQDRRASNDTLHPPRVRRSASAAPRRNAPSSSPGAIDAAISRRQGGRSRARQRTSVAVPRGRGAGCAHSATSRRGASGARASADAAWRTRASRQRCPDSWAMRHDARETDVLPRAAGRVDASPSVSRPSDISSTPTTSERHGRRASKSGATSDEEHRGRQVALDSSRSCRPYPTTAGRRSRRQRSASASL
jgi:hypothetical protein